MSERQPIEESTTPAQADENAMTEMLRLVERLSSLLQGEFGKLVTVELDALLTLEQCSKWLQVDPKTLSPLAKRGKIPCIKVGSSFRFHPRTIMAECRFFKK